MEIRSYLTKNVRQLLDVFSEGILITDEKMIVRYVNPSFIKYAKMSYNDFVGKFMPNIRPSTHIPAVLESKEALFNVHRVIPHKGGFVESYVDIIPLFKDIQKKDDQVIGILVIVRDAKVLNDFFAMMSEQKKRVEVLDKQIRDVFSVQFNFDNIIGMDSSFGKLAIKASSSNGSVILMGESGTGKEVMAQSIHAASKRSEGPFVDINCAALPENLLESELFGYVSGAFTGANKNGKMGLFEVAAGGTIFLDEISEMPLSLQGKLLRVLQEKHIRKLGENRNIGINVRVVAATNKNLENLIATGLFREDLFYRLAMFVIEIPPLRERKKDIEKFLQYFLNERYKKHHKKISIAKDAKTLLLSYNWPGNVRELENAIGYACDVTESDIIRAIDLPGYITKKKYHSEAISPINIDRSKWQGKKNLNKIMEDLEKQILSEAIKEYGENLEGRKKMADVLGISLSTLYYKLNKHSLA